MRRIVDFDHKIDRVVGRLSAILGRGSQKLSEPKTKNLSFIFDLKVYREKAKILTRRFIVEYF